MITTTTNIDSIIRFEQGDLTWDESVELIQDMIDTGLIWQLQGSYGRLAQSMIDQGICFNSLDRPGSVL